MLANWFRPEHNRDPKSKADFEAAVRNSTVLITRFNEILREEEENLYRYEGDLKNYDGDWAAKQAFINGKRAQIRIFKKFFDFNS